MSTFKKIYKKVANNGDSNDYQEVGTVGVNGVNLDIMKGASSSVDGEIGLVPKPTKGHQNQYLRADGTWQTPPDTNTTYSVFNGTNDGLVPKTNKSYYFLTGNGSWDYPWIDNYIEDGRSFICLGSGKYQLSKKLLSEATTTNSGLMSTIDKSLLVNYLMLSPIFICWYDDSISMGTVSDTAYKGATITHYIYEKEVNNVSDSKINKHLYPLLLKLVQNNVTDINYDPIDNGCTFGNIESIWNENNGTISKDYQNNTNCIKIQYKIYVNVRTHTGTHTITARSHTYLYLSMKQRNFIANNCI